MFTLKNIDEITENLLYGQKYRQNFPKTVTFNFSDLYLSIVTQITTREISADFILFNTVKSVNTTIEFADISYWAEDCNTDIIADYWFIGTTGQGDHWVIDDSNHVYFIDHTDIISVNNIRDLGLTFDTWLQLAYVHKDLETIINAHELTDKTLNTKITVNFMECVRALSPLLEEQYPFELF